MNWTTRRFPRTLAEAFPIDHGVAITHYRRAPWPWSFADLVIAALAVAVLGAIALGVM